MNLQNGYKVIYEKIADSTRTFYATKNAKCDPAVDDKIVEAEIGKYKLIYEKAGRFYGSETGIPAEGDYCFEGFDKVFVAEEATEAQENLLEEPQDEETPAAVTSENEDEETEEVE